MNRRSFLRLLGLGVPGLALFGWFRRAEPPVDVSYRMDFGATRLDPEGVVTIEGEPHEYGWFRRATYGKPLTFACSPELLDDSELYGRSPLEPAMEALRAQHEADRAQLRRFYGRS